MLTNTGITALKGPLSLLAAFVLAGTSVIAARYVTGKLGVFTITAVSLLFTLACLLPLCCKQMVKTLRRMPPKAWLMLVLQAAGGIFLFRLFLLEGLLRTSAGEAGILTGATPAVTAILAAVWLKESMSTKSWLGLVSTVAGIIVLNGLLATGSGFAVDHVIGNLLVLAAALCESIFNILSRITNTRKLYRMGGQVSPVVQTALVSLAAFCLCLVPALFEHPLPALSRIGWLEWSSLAWYGCVVTALAFIFWYAGIMRCRASVAAAFSGMMPFTALLLSVLVLGEQYGWRQWSGGILVVLGMILAGGRAVRAKRTQDPLSYAKNEL